jgi:hypothetical protein
MQMAASSVPLADNELQAAAIAKGFVEVSVVQHTSREQKDALDKGVWFVLSVKRKAGDDWDILGRRRTVPELIGILNKQCGNN